MAIVNFTEAVRDEIQGHMPLGLDPDRAKLFVDLLESFARDFQRHRNRWPRGFDGNANRRDRRDRPAKQDSAPHLDRIADALATIERELRQLPTSVIAGADLDMRLAGYRGILDDTEYRAIEAEAGEHLAALDRHDWPLSELDFAHPSAPSLRVSLARLSSAIAAQQAKVQALPDNRPRAYRKRELMASVIWLYRMKIGPPLADGALVQPLRRILLAVFRWLDDELALPGIDDKTLLAQALDEALALDSHTGKGTEK